MLIIKTLLKTLLLQIASLQNASLPNASYIRTKHMYRKKRLSLHGANTLENRDGEQRALRSTNLSFIKMKRYFAPSDLADTSKIGQ